MRGTVLLLVAAIAAAQVAPLAVTTTVVPPARPSDPVPVFLVDFGRTPGLVLAAGSNRMVAYVYGDWNYYALRRQGVADSLAALLWPTTGALGRKEIAGPANAHTVRAGIGAEVERLHAIEVERQAVVGLLSKLDRLYRHRLATSTQSYGMTFVHHPDAYTYWSNSNHMTADWLRELGCAINGPAFSSSWRIERAASPPA